MPMRRSVRKLSRVFARAGCGTLASMPTCRECDDEVDVLVTVKVDGKSTKRCEDCADRAREAAEIAEASEGVVQQMMGFKGRR
jgi:hypothetical protein